MPSLEGGRALAAEPSARGWTRCLTNLFQLRWRVWYRVERVTRAVSREGHHDRCGAEGASGSSGVKKPQPQPTSTTTTTTKNHHVRCVSQGAGELAQRSQYVKELNHKKSHCHYRVGPSGHDKVSGVTRSRGGSVESC